MVLEARLDCRVLSDQWDQLDLKVQLVHKANKVKVDRPAWSVHPVTQDQLELQDHQDLGVPLATLDPRDVMAQ